MTSIEISNSVTSIGHGAFKGCNGLTSIEISNSVTSIRNTAFEGCTGLASIIIDSGNHVYDSRKNCNAIIETASNTLITGCKNTEIPNSVTCIGNGAFKGCNGLASIEIPNCVASIGNGAFDGCKGLISIEIPNSVTSIGNEAFSGCSNLTSIDIPNSVTCIGNGAFKGCTGLTSIEIPNSVTNIGNGAFKGCTGLISTEIPYSITNIGEGAFSGCKELSKIEIPNSVANIRKQAFCDCPIENIEIPNYTLLDKCAICKCGKLKAINTLSNPYYHSTDGVLYSKNMKVLVKMPEGKTGEYIVASETETIGEGAFCRSALNTVRLSDNIIKIESKAFNIASFQELHIRNEHPENLEIGKNAFEGLENCTLYVPIGTGYAYRHHPAFAGKFKEVIIER